MAEKKSRGGLGRSFYDIFEDNDVGAAKGGPAEMIRLSNIEPRKDQPRKNFDKEALEQLADSIGRFGVLQPIVVRESSLASGTYEIIAGERRWRAAKLAGLTEIAAVVIDGDELKAAIKGKILDKDADLVGNMASEGTTPRRLTDLIGSLCDLTSGSGDKGTPIVHIQGYFDNYTTE